MYDICIDKLLGYLKILCLVCPLWKNIYSGQKFPQTAKSRLRLGTQKTYSCLAFDQS